jgi:glycosyltransferase involved in cell wall biosynthesis
MAHNRLLRVFRHLPRYGYEPVMLTDVCRHEPYKFNLPADRVEQVPCFDLQYAYMKLRGAKVAQSTTAAQKPESRAIGFTTFINRWFLVPDKQIFWCGPARRVARARALREKFDVVFASNLPATNGITGAKIARSLGLPFVVEYRDLWTGNPYHNLTHPTALHRALNARLERAMLRNASRVSCLSTGIADRIAEMYDDVLREKPQVNYNFFDPGEFPATGLTPQKPGAFTISYVGAMYLSRNPEMFFRGLRLFITRHQIAPEQLRFRWLGLIVGIAGLQEMICRNGMEPYIDFLGQIPHGDALNELRRSQVSLVIQSADDAIHIPGKIFEAMGARVPLLAIANPCEVTSIIDRTQAGLHCPHDPGAVADTIEKLWKHSLSGATWKYEDTEVCKFSVDRAVARIAGMLDEATSGT